MEMAGGAVSKIIHKVFLFLPQTGKKKSTGFIGK
jgi:hypothetical protein